VSVRRCASPPSGRIRYNWFRDEAFSGASRFDRKKNARPSLAHRGDASFLSRVNVIWRVEETPSRTDTR
jgi:hypothetical protein